MISVILPFFNERENLKELHSRLLGTLSSLKESWEMIFVDDGSTDGGGKFLKSLFSDSEPVRIIRLDRNYGLSSALQAGFDAAEGDVLVTLDADLQNPPEEIPRLLQLLSGVDMVTGVRRPRQDPWLKRATSAAANGIRRLILKDRMQDISCTLRVFRRPVLQAYLPYQGIHRFFPALAEAGGYRVLQVPVKHHRRLRGFSKYGLRNRLAGPFWDLLAVRWLLARKIHYQIEEKS